jgi:hypothetical protein
MSTLLDIVKVEPREGYILVFEFENGERRVFDMGPYLDKPPFIKLKDPVLFDRATITNGTVSWPGNIDLAPETLYDRSVPA